MFILIVAALVTIVDLFFNANLHELYLVLGIFIPLIVTNCIVLARVEAYAARTRRPIGARRRFSWASACWDAGTSWRPARTDRQRHPVSGINMVLPPAAHEHPLWRTLPRLPDRDPAARRLHPARLHDRLEELDRCARLPPTARRARTCRRLPAASMNAKRAEIFARLRAANLSPTTELNTPGLPVARRVILSPKRQTRRQ